MNLLNNYVPALRYGAKILTSEILGDGFNDFNNIWYVDGTNGSDNNTGNTPTAAFATIQAAVTAASRGDTIYIRPKAMASGATDPVDYAETIIIPADKDGLRLIGVHSGRTQGGLPQIKIGAGSTAMLTVRAPGCLIANLGFNGASSTGGGILLDDDGSTKTAFGTTIVNCHFKNCKCHATNGTLGGGIYTSSAGGAWQVRILGNTFYKNVASIVVVGTTGSVPQDWIIEDNNFGSSAEGASSESDVDIYIGGSGTKGLLVRNNYFLTPDVPTLASGSVGRYISLATGTTGMVSGNSFACLVNPAATEVTFGAAGTAAIIPTTVRLANNWGETSSTTERPWVNRV